jgi:hypothetical protein
VQQWRNDTACSRQLSRLQPQYPSVVVRDDDNDDHLDYPHLIVTIATHHQRQDATGTNSRVHKMNGSSVPLFSTCLLRPSPLLVDLESNLDYLQSCVEGQYTGIDDGLERLQACRHKGMDARKVSLSGVTRSAD